MHHRSITILLFLLVLGPTFALGQWEAGGYYTHLTGDNGLNGFSAEGGWHYTPHVSFIAEGDFLWNNSRLGTFDLTPLTAGIAVKSNFQGYFGGARFRIRGFKPLKTLEKRKLLPFAEVLLGASRLHQSITSGTGVISASASATSFTWLLGGGVDYTLNAHWLARGKLDFERTHFVNEGQSHLRINLGVSYVF